MPHDLCNFFRFLMNKNNKNNNLFTTLFGQSSRAHSPEYCGSGIFCFARNLPIVLAPWQQQLWSKKIFSRRLLRGLWLAQAQL